MREPQAAIIGMVCAAALGLTAAAQAHPASIAKASLDFPASGQYRLVLECDVAALVMQAVAGHLDDELVEEARTMPRQEWEAHVADARRAFEHYLSIAFDGQAAAPLVVELPEPERIRAPPLADEERRPQVIRVVGLVPAGASGMTVAFPADLGLVVLTATTPDGTLIRQPLSPEQTSPVILLRPTEAITTSSVRTAYNYLAWGFEHILPEGMDHILFVLGLFLLSPKLKPLAWQITAFTIAHSITLGFSIYGFVSLPSHVVEPLIAASITLVAVENVFTPELKPWRPMVVFLFGLLHGLGFAGVLEEAGLPPDEFLTALVSFNVGVELGQLAVIVLALAAVGWFRNRPWYRARIVIPASLAIAAVGLYWTVERIVAQGT